MFSNKRLFEKIWTYGLYFVLAFLLWWNSQSLAVKIVVSGDAGLLLILSIICCYCCCCKQSGSGEAVVNTRPAVVMPAHILLQNPAEKQFQYNKKVNEIA